MAPTSNEIGGAYYFALVHYPYAIIMAPTSNEIGGAYYFAFIRLSILSSVCQAFCACTILRVDPYFFLFDTYVLSELCPFEKIRTLSTRYIKKYLSQGFEI